jgi:hypothetical protein
MLHQRAAARGLRKGFAPFRPAMRSSSLLGRRVVVRAAEEEAPAAAAEAPAVVEESFTFNYSE